MGNKKRARGIVDVIGWEAWREYDLSKDRAAVGGYRFNRRVFDGRREGRFQTGSVSLVAFSRYSGISEKQLGRMVAHGFLTGLRAKWGGGRKSWGFRGRIWYIVYDEYFLIFLRHIGLIWRSRGQANVWLRGRWFLEYVRDMEGYFRSLGLRRDGTPKTNGRGNWSWDARRWGGEKWGNEKWHRGVAGRYLKKGFAQDIDASAWEQWRD